MRLGRKRKTSSEQVWDVVRSAAGFAPTTSMIEARLRLRTASMCGENTGATLGLFGHPSRWIVYKDPREEREGGEGKRV